MKNISKLNKKSQDFFATYERNLEKKPYSATTEGIEVNVWPEFLDYQNNSLIGNLYVWAYYIRIDNRSSNKIKLINRHWKITDEKGEVEEVDGDDIVGEQPLIEPYQSFQYSSGVHLKYPSGIMSGYYTAIDDNGRNFQVKIPSFSLDVPTIKDVLN